MRPPRATPIQALFVEPLSEWSVASVRTALDEHERGRFRQSARLADAMGRDPDIAGALATRVRALASKSTLPFKIEASSEGDGRKREAARKREEELWWYSCPEDVIGALLRDAIMLGVAIGYIEWVTTAGEWIPRLRWLPPHGLQWFRFGIDGRGAPEWGYYTQFGEILRVTPGDGTWFLLLPQGERSWMTGCVRSCGIPWLGRLLATRDWLRYDEKHGLPILAIKEPHWAADDVEGTDGAGGSKADQFYRQFATMPSESCLREPQGPTKDEGGWDATWLEPVANTWETFQATIRQFKGDIHQALLGRDVSAPAKGGDGEVMTERVRVEYLSSDAESFSTATRDQEWCPWAEYNYGDRLVAGWACWSTRPLPDMQQRAETLDKVGDACTKLATLGIDVAPVLEEFGLKAPPGGVQPPPAPAAPQQQAQKAA
jgi:hypothetical protein